MKLTSTLIALAIGVITANSAHAEKYCKSVDQSGNASYTLAPETGCNKKKSKTVSVLQRTTQTTTVTSTPGKARADAEQAAAAANAAAAATASAAAAAIGAAPAVNSAPAANNDQ